MNHKNYVDYVPRPEPVSSDFYMMCHYYPGWAVRHNGWSDFSNLLDFPERTPLMGFYDERNPEVIDWEIKWAVEHGIKCFVYCWYRRTENIGNPVTKADLFYAHQLDALEKARYRDMMDFAIMWEGDCAGCAADQDDLVNNLIPFWVENYFSKPNYTKIGNKPLLFVYDHTQRIIRTMGGPEKMREAWDACREKMKEYGFDGLVLQTENRYDDLAILEMYRTIGYDQTFAYCWNTLEQFPTQEQVLERQLSLMKSHLDFDPNFTTLTCSQAWDPFPWHRNDPNRLSTITRWKLTPQNWRLLLEKVKELADSMPESALGRRYVMLDNWNEWCEGHYIAPHLDGGFKYLQAVREVFTNRDNLPDYRLPQTLGLGPYDQNIDLSAPMPKGFD